MIISLDIATKTGYYVEGSDRAYTVDLGNTDERYYNFYTFLVDVTESFDSKDLTIVYEQAPFQKGFATPVNPGLVGVLKSFCVSRGIKYTSIPVQTVKRVFLDGKRWTEKECRDYVLKKKAEGDKRYKLTVWKKAPIMEKCDSLGIDYIDDNGADAYAVYRTHVKTGASV